MSTISSAALQSVFSPNYQATSTNNTAKALDAIDSALQSDSSSDALTALTSLQQSLSTGSSGSSTSTSQPFGTNTQANTDYTNLVSDIQSGNLDDAKTSLANLQTDLKSHKGGHHHGGGAPPPPPTTTTTTTTSTTSSESTSGNFVNVTV
jgi:hypothetical protein